MNVKLDLNLSLDKVKVRDKLVFAFYVTLITTMFQAWLFEPMKWDPSRISLVVIMISQFYLTAYIKFPINRLRLRQISYIIFHVANFIVFKEIVSALAPAIVVNNSYFQFGVIIFFLLVVLGRDIRLYTTLAGQLSNLERWTERKILFEKPEKIKIHLGEAGGQFLHPNEILYIRTKSAGDHTKIFGIKSRVNHKFREYETIAYKNFDEIGKVLIQFPQFKRISQSTVINYKYPFEENNGIITIQGRRFNKSKIYQK